MKYYDVEYLSEKYEDPYKYNIFGNYVKSDNMQLEKGRLTGKSKNFDIRIYSFTKKTKNPEEWIEGIRELSERKVNYKKDWKEVTGAEKIGRVQLPIEGLSVE